MVKTLTFLGTGTSTGVPALLCDCDTCRSTDPHDKRLRASALLGLSNGNNLLIDCGPDFRQQMLSQPRNNRHLEGVLLTHVHYDHVGGIDDLRPYCHLNPDFPVYARADVARDLRSRLPYCFAENPYPGVPQFKLHEIKEGVPFTAAGVVVTPIPVMHGRLPILGFRIGTLAYITDALTIPEEGYSILQGVETLVINALRHKPHPSHMSLTESLATIERIAPRHAYLIHMADAMGRHANIAPSLPPNITLAYDNLTLTL